MSKYKTLEVTVERRDVTKSKGTSPMHREAEGQRPVLVMDHHLQATRCLILLPPPPKNAEASTKRSTTESGRKKMEALCPRPKEGATGWDLKRLTPTLFNYNFLHSLRKERH